MPRLTCLMLSVLLLSALVSLSESWSPYHETHMLEGRSVIVQMFEWRFDDLARECEEFLGPKGFGGIQVSPPVTEHAVVTKPSYNEKVMHPWYQRYQAISYKLDSRSGSRRELQDMIQRCNKAGVRVYIDVIMNHMTADLDGPGEGFAGSKFNGKEFVWPDYNRTHFNSKLKCGTKDGGIANFDDHWEARNCELLGLHDLDQSQEYVQNKLTTHVNELIDMGVAGFRVDASKHMYPEHILQIFEKAKFLDEALYGKDKRPLVYHEARTGDRTGIRQEDYTIVGRAINFPFMEELAPVLLKLDGKRLANLKTFGHSWGLVKSEDSISIIDNHDIQREDAPKMYFKDERVCRMANAFMLAWPYGIPKIMSSFNWMDREFWTGPPHEENYSTKHVTFGGERCGDRWICEHRWRPVANMVGFRNASGEAPVDNWWDNGSQQIAFSRRGQAFIAINNERDLKMEQWLQTSLPAGAYCDVISGSLDNGTCTGRTIQVQADGKALIEIPHDESDPMVAIHVNSKL